MNAGNLSFGFGKTGGVGVGPPKASHNSKLQRKATDSSINSDDGFLDEGDGDATAVGKPLKTQMTRLETGDSSSDDNGSDDDEEEEDTESDDSDDIGVRSLLTLSLGTISGMGRRRGLLARARAWWLPSARHQKHRLSLQPLGLALRLRWWTTKKTSRELASATRTHHPVRAQST